MKDPSNTSTILKIEGMHCASCQRPIEKALRETVGVEDVSVNLANREVSVESSISNEMLIEAVASAGFDAIIDPIQSLEEADRVNQENFRRLIYKTILALGSGFILMLYAMHSTVITMTKGSFWLEAIARIAESYAWRMAPLGQEAVILLVVIFRDTKGKKRPLAELT